MEIKRVAKSEENYAAVVALKEELPVSYLFCMSDKRQSGQRISVKVCEKKECPHLRKDDNGRIRCGGPTSIYYIGAMKRLSKEELAQVKKEIKEGKSEV